MEGEPRIPAVMDALPRDETHSRPSSTLRGPGRGVEGAEASSRAMHEVRRSILRKLAPRFHTANQLSSRTE
jgi:hypothetical protein